MTTVFDISMSLDGYITAADQTAAEPMGKGGEVLHNWAVGDDPRSREYMTPAGAMIAGRVTYDHSLPWWGADGPGGPARVPTVVVTHEAPAQSPEGGVYEFVTGGIEEALERARAVSGNDVVAVMGGASLGQQFIQAGLIDEISIHLVPVLLGGGTRLFDNMKIDHTWLEAGEVVRTPAATHLRFRVLKPETAHA